MDWSTSPGATIQTLLHMWRADYRNEKKPMDVLIIGGLNNILRGEAVDKIMNRFEEFVKAVELQGWKQHGVNRSTDAISTFFYPPQLCWFEKNGPIPHPNYINHLDMMINLNDRIMELNQRIFVSQRQIYREEINGQEPGVTLRAPKFHTFAVKNKKHRLDWYREEDVSKKLHLKDRHRSTLGRAAGNYFKKMFDPSTA